MSWASVRGWWAFELGLTSFSCVLLLSLSFSLQLMLLLPLVVLLLLVLLYFTLFQLLDCSYLNPQFFFSWFFSQPHWDASGCVVFSCQLESNYNKVIGLQDVSIVVKVAVFTLIHMHKLSTKLPVFWFLTYWWNGVCISYRSRYSFWKQTCL